MKKVHRFTVGLVLAGMVVLQLYVATITPSTVFANEEITPTPTPTPLSGTCNEVSCGG